MFLLIVTSRRDELTSLRGDLQDRMKRKKQEREAAKLAWEAVQRVELCMTRTPAYEVVGQTAHALGCSLVQFACDRDDISRSDPFQKLQDETATPIAMSGPSAIFRLSSGQGHWLTVSLALPTDSSPAADIVFRYLQRLSLTLADRLDWLQSSTSSNDIETEAIQHRSRRAPLLVPAPEGRG